ncbi:unnamed protein product [Chrysoparadoxa australica]
MALSRQALQVASKRRRRQCAKVQARKRRLDKDKEEAVIKSLRSVQREEKRRKAAETLDLQGLQRHLLLAVVVGSKYKAQCKRYQDVIHRLNLLQEWGRSAIIIQRCWRCFCTWQLWSRLRKSRRALKALLPSLKAQAQRAKAVVAERKRHAGVETLVHFLSHSGSLLATKCMSRFRARVIKCQRYFHQYKMCTRLRMMTLRAYWDREEEAIDKARAKMYTIRIKEMRCFDMSKLDHTIHSIAEVTRRSGPVQSRLFEPMARCRQRRQSRVKPSGQMEKEVGREAALISKRGLKYRSIPLSLKTELLSNLLGAMRQEYKRVYWPGFKQYLVLKENERLSELTEGNAIDAFENLKEKLELERSKEMARLKGTGLMPLTTLTSQIMRESCVLAERMAACAAADAAATGVINMDELQQIFMLHCLPNTSAKAALGPLAKAAKFPHEVEYGPILVAEERRIHSLIVTPTAGKPVPKPEVKKSSGSLSLSKG